MGRLLFFIALGIAVVYLFRKLNQTVIHKPPPTAEPRPSTTSELQTSEPMVRCAKCGIHLPRSEAILSQGSTYCCPQHAKIK